MIRTSLNQRHLYFFYLSLNIYIKIILKLRTFHFLFSNELSLVSEPVSLFKERKKNPPNSKHQILRERIRKKKNKIEIIEISNNPIIDASTITKLSASIIQQETRCIVWHRGVRTPMKWICTGDTRAHRAPSRPWKRLLRGVIKRNYFLPQNATVLL